MSELTILLSVEPETNRFRFFVIELRRLPDGSAELHRRWGRIGTQGRHEVEEFSTVPLAETARRTLIERRRRRGYVRADSATLGPHDLDPLVAWEAHLTRALDTMRRRLSGRREDLRHHVATDAAQLALPL